MRRTLRSSFGLLASVLLAHPTSAATGPVTPTFLVAWGSPGAAPAQFASPVGVSTDVLGDVYVADQGNHRIQKFDRLGNYVTRWGGPGNGNGQFNSPTGVATDPSGNVYVADNGNHRIQKFSRTGSYLAQWGGPGSGNAQFNSPTDVAIDADGNVYVVDQGNQRVQKFTSAGAFTSTWGTPGNGPGQFSGPYGIATGPGGHVYVADQGNQRIQKFTADGAFLIHFGSVGSGDGQFTNPTGITTDAVGNVYVTDLGNHRIVKFAADGTFLTKWGSGPGSGNGQFNAPTGVAADAAGNIYVVEFSGTRIQEFSGSGSLPAEGTPGFLSQWGNDGTLNGPRGLCAYSGGIILVVDSQNDRVRMYSQTGVFILNWGTAGIGNGQFNFPQAVAADVNGFIYVTDWGNDRVQIFNSNLSYVTQFGGTGTGPGQFRGPRGIVIDAVGYSYVADQVNNRVQRFLNGIYVSQWGSGGSGNGQFISPSSVALDGAGNVYVCDTGNHRVQKFTATGVYLGKWGSMGTGNGQFNSPSWVTTDSVGNVYVVDEGNYRVQKFSGTGLYLAQWGTNGIGSGQFISPHAAIVHPNGFIHVVDTGNSSVKRFAHPPVVWSITDIGHDQGRQVRLRIQRSGADVQNSPVPVLRYDVYRRIDPLPAAVPTGVAKAQLAGWDQVGSVSARGDAEYNVVVPTLVDATTSSSEYSAFFVSAATGSPTTFYDSGVLDGYSVDNLSPPAPAPFAGSFTSGATHLWWGASPAGDFAVFRLYRGASADFVPTPANRLTETTSYGFVDPAPQAGYYKLAAVDFNDNEGPYAALAPNQILEVGGPGPIAFGLEGTRPNPAPASRLMVTFRLPSSEPATLELLDVAGRRVSGRPVGALGPGRHEVDLGAGVRLRPGLYLLRLVQGSNRQVVRTALID